MYLDFFFLVDVDVDNDLILVREVIFLIDGDFGILETLVVVIAFDEEFGPVDEVGGNLVAFYQAEALFKFFAFRLFYADVVDLRDAGALLQGNVEPHLVAGHLGYRNGNVGKEALFPKPLNGIGDGFAGNLDDIAHRKARISDDDKIFVIVGGSRHGNVGYLIFSGQGTIVDGRIVNRIDRSTRLRELGHRRGGKKKGKEKHDQQADFPE